MLLLNIFLSCLFLFLSLLNLRRRQKHYGYILPGWIIIILLFVYSVPASLLYFLNPDLLNKTFNRFFSYDTILGCQSCFTLVIASYTFMELFFTSKFNSINKSVLYIKNNIVIQNRKYKILILILFLLSFFLYLKRWSSVGGISGMLVVGRANALYEIQTSGGSFARYDILLFLSSSLFIPYILLVQTGKDKKFAIIMLVLYGLFFFLLLLSGTRLPIISIFLGFLSLLYIFKKEWLRKKAKSILLFAFISYLLLNTYTFFRNDVFNIKSNINSTDLSTIEIFFPNETLTAYLSYDAMIKYPDVFYDNQFLKILPGKLRTFIGLDPFIPYSARLQDVRMSQSTLTVPFPIDLYFGTKGNYLFIFLFSLFTFLIIEYTFYLLSRNNYGILFITWLYFISFYFIRTESIAWFSRVLLLYLFGSIIILCLKIRFR